MSELNWDEYIEEEPITDPGFCLWCRFAVMARNATKGNLKWGALKTYHEENHGRVHPFEFARESQRIYNECLRDHLTDEDGCPIRGPAWPAKNIHEHAITHVVIAICNHRENAMVYQTALRRIRDNGLFRSDGSVCLKHFKAFTEAEKNARVLLDKVDQSKSNSLFGFC